VAGKLKSEKFDPSTLSMVLVEKSLPVPVGEDGQFVINKVLEGEYHLDILFNKKVLKRQKIQVPGADYDILV
jgi:outer membrane usher protein FimD/PapC